MDGCMDGLRSDGGCRGEGSQDVKVVVAFVGKGMGSLA